MNIIATTFAAAFVVLPLSVAPVGAALAQGEGDCVSPLQAQQAVEAGRILDLSSAAAREGVARKFIGDEARLCEIDGSPHWVVILQNAAGDSERVVLNAQGD
jgi:hypothetical protein